MSLLIALTASSIAHAAPPEVRRLDDDVRTLRVDIPAGDVIAVRDSSLDQIELRTRKLQWDDGCALEVMGTLRTRVSVEEPFLSRAECAVELELRLPDSIDLIVHVDEGTVALEQLGGDTRVRIGEGALTLADVRGGVSVRMDKGTVSGTHISEDVSVELVDGSIELKGASQIAGDQLDSGGAG